MHMYYLYIYIILVCGNTMCYLVRTWFEVCLQFQSSLRQKALLLSFKKNEYVSLKLQEIEKRSCQKRFSDCVFIV